MGLEAPSNRRKHRALQEDFGQRDTELEVEGCRAVGTVMILAKTYDRT